MANEIDINNVSDTAYDATVWAGVTSIAPSKNAVQEELVALGARHPIADKFLSVDYGAGIYRVTSAESWMLQRVGNERYVRWRLTQPSGLPGSHLVHQITRSDVASPMLSIDDDDAAMVRAGTWTQASQAAAYGGDYYWSATAGDTITWTTPDNTIKVGARFPFLSNAGVITVTIDGSLTRANLLPTAQELVDNGQLASTALVANGGTLAPTTRCVDLYAGTAAYDNLIGLADDLTAGVHTVVFTVTAYKRAASSATRLYLGGGMYATAATTIATSSTELCSLAEVIGPAASALEYAHKITPTGASTATFVGSVHGYETQESITYAIDGATVSLSDATRQFGRRIVVTRVTALKHPEIGSGATTVATVKTVYTVDEAGLRVKHSTTWEIGGTTTSSYPVMFPVSNMRMFKGGIDTAEVATLVANAGGYLFRRPARVAYLWHPQGKIGACVFVPNPQATVGGWASSGATGVATNAGWACIEDRALTGLVNKVYFTRVSAEAGAVTITAGDVWTSDAIYRAAYFPGGAEGALN